MSTTDESQEKLGDKVVFGMVGLLFVWIFLDSMIGVLK